jgi:superfamily II DNA or RNA helicase
VAVVTLTGDEVSLHDAVGTAVLLRGRALARTGQVTVVRSDGGGAYVRGQVTSQAEVFSVIVDVGRSPDGTVEFVGGRCSCGQPAPCQHAVALLLAAADDGATPGPAGPPQATLRHAPNRPAPWEAALSDALTPRPAGRTRVGSAHAAPPAAESPAVGLQFELIPADRGRTRIALRPVRPGRSDGWVRTGISWSTLQYGGYHHRPVPAEQLRLLHELLALEGQRYSYRDTAVHLDAIRSRRVWDLLVEAQEIGLPLVLASRPSAPVRVHADAAVARLTVSRSAGAAARNGSGDHGVNDAVLAVRPALVVGDRTVQADLLIGEPPHGVAWRSGGNEHGHATPDHGLDLAPLATAPHPAFRALIDRGDLLIPATDEQHFLHHYYPKLRQSIEVVCPDGSVPLPAAEPPVLTLTVTGLGKHRAALDWSWLYTIGSNSRAEPLAVPGTGPAGRDIAAETRILAEITPLLTTLPAPSGTPALVEQAMSGLRPVAAATVADLAMAKLLADVVPAVAQREDVTVRLDLEPGLPDYREVDSPPEIRFTNADSTDGPLGGRDWFDLAVAVSVDGHQVPFERLFVALAEERSHLILDNGVYFRLDREEFAQLARLIAESRALLDAPPGTVRLNRFQAGLWDDLERVGKIIGQADAWRESVRTLSRAADLPEHPVPAGLRAELRSYQRTGFGWLSTLFTLGLGGVLADDMGLGKTLQTLALIVHAREQGRTDLPFLIVAPTSVVSTWATEAARFAPGLRVATVTQTAARRGHPLADSLVGADLVVTSYTLFRLEFGQYQDHRWAGLVLDEAQNVKNHRSAGYGCAKELAVATGFKLAITGTPMENNLMELWSLLSITAPGLFARPERFTEYYRTPIERDRDADRLDQLRRRVRPLLLRRTKDQVAADLPERQEQVLELELNPRHRTVYQRYLQRERRKVLGLLGDLNRNRFEILRSLTLLRQASLDVGLVDPEHAGVPSTKLDALLDQVVDIVAEGHRVLVFSQFTRFLGRARERLKAAGVDYCYLAGTTRNRPEVIARFRAGTAPVFLISLKAGGSGLTLTEADYVILLDPWWNPATEAQAVDRAHRIGQTRKVIVYRLVAKDTIEEKVMALKAAKAALTSSVLDGGDFASGALTVDDIRDMLG